MKKKGEGKVEAKGEGREGQLIGWLGFNCALTQI